MRPPFCIPVVKRLWIELNVMTRQENFHYCWIQLKVSKISFPLAKGLLVLKIIQSCLSSSQLLASLKTNWREIEFSLSLLLLLAASPSCVVTTYRIWYFRWLRRLLILRLWQWKYREQPWLVLGHPSWNNDVWTHNKNWRLSPTPKLKSNMHQFHLSSWSGTKNNVHTTSPFFKVRFWGMHHSTSH